MSKSIAYSPLNPKFTEADRLIWAANASRFAETRRGGTLHLADQGKGHAADLERVREHMADWTAEDVAGFYAFLTWAKAMREREAIPAGQAVAA